MNNEASKLDGDSDTLQRLWFFCVHCVLLVVCIKFVFVLFLSLFLVFANFLLSSALACAVINLKRALNMY